jgi:hypothetical protein
MEFPMKKTSIVGVLGALTAAALAMSATASANTGDSFAAIDEDGRVVIAQVESDAALAATGLLDEDTPDVMRVAVNFICPPPPPPPPPPPNPN